MPGKTGRGPQSYNRHLTVEEFVIGIVTSHFDVAWKFLE